MWRKFGKLWRIVAAIAMVASMATALMPAIATAQDNGCLQVNIVTPVNDAEIALKQYFWVNATVAKPAGVASAHDIEACIAWEGNARLVEGDECQGGEELTGCAPATDFWWLFQCTGYGPVNFTVTATSSDCAEGSACVTVQQPAEPCDPVLEVTIIECPETDVTPSNVFAIKALVTNVSDYPVCDVYGTIEWDPESGASLVDCENEWCLDTIQPGCSKEVGWTLHCEEGGDLEITVDAYAESLEDCEVLEDTCTVHQLLPAAMTVELIAPDEICTECDPNFCVTAKICETNGDVGIVMVMPTLTILSGNAELAGVLPTQGPFSVGPDGCIEIPWPVRCTGTGDVEFKVDVTGYDAMAMTVLNASDTVIIEQDPLIVNIVSPSDKAKFNVNGKYDLVYTLQNCMNELADNVTIGIVLPANISLAETTVYVDCDSPSVPDTVTATLVYTDNETGERRYEANLGCFCSCCAANITWKLQCTGSGVEDCTPTLDTIQAFVKINDEIIDDDEVCVYQLLKAHLVAGLEVFEGADSTFEGDDRIEGISPGDNFTVVVPVVNLGESAANDVIVTLCASGNVQMLNPQSNSQTIASIPCHGAAKAIWTFQCTGEGDVTLSVCGIAGTDATTGQAIPADNIELTCPIVIKQIPIIIEIIQPLTCTDFTVGETFTVKARITNNSTLGETLSDVEAELKWTGQMCLADGQGNPVDLNDLLPLEVAEATWQVKCTGPGDVTFYVEVEAEEPYMEKYSGSETIHQWNPGELSATVLSPLPIYTYFEGACDPFSPSYIATSQDFALTAEVHNSGGFPITITDAPVTFPLGGASVVSGPRPALPVTISPDESIVFNWTLHCDEGGLTPIIVNFLGEDTLCLTHEAITATAVMQYPAAHLEVGINCAPSEPITVGSEFTVCASITNTGEADAWDAVAILSVSPEGSVRVSPNDPDGGYVKPLDGLVGHGQDGTSTVSWVLQCMEATPSTITITAAGFDEFGYHTKQRWSYDCDHWVLDLEKEPGRPIEARNVEPDSVTVEQVVGNGGAEPASGSITVALEENWNLFAPPFYVVSDDRPPAAYFASIADNVNKVWSYSSATDAWKYWVPGNGSSTLNEIRDGNGYWLKMDYADTLTISGDTMPPAGPEPPPSYSVYVGWNLIGIRAAAPVKASEWLNTIAGKYGIIYGFDNGHYFAVGPNDNLVPGQGYWIAITQPGTILH